MSTVRIGTSGWTYPPWRGRFYPAGLARAQELHYLSERLDAVEINATFYRLQRPTTYTKWAGQVTGDFTFAIKGWKQVTHVRRLREAGQDVAAFFGSGVLNLGTRLGPILWQLPPSLAFDPDALEAFLAGLPRTVGEASAAGVVVDNDEGATPADDAQLALLPEPATQAAAPEQTPIRYAIEPRNASFRRPEALEIMRAHGAAMVVSDTAGRYPMFEEVTADFAYVRLHGSPRLYFSRYSDAAIVGWAEQIRAWRADGVGAQVFFDNTGAGHAPENALALSALLTP